MARTPPESFLRGRSAGGFMSPKTREDRCKATTLRELTRLTTSKKFQHWLREKSSSSVLWWSRFWATSSFVLILLLALTVSHFQQQLSETGSELAGAQDRMSGIQSGTVSGVVSVVDERKLEGQIKKGRQENAKLLVEVQAVQKENEALQLKVQNMRSEVHDLETRESKLKQGAERLAKGLKQKELDHSKKVQDMKMQEIQLREEAKRLAKLLEEQQHEHNKKLHDMEVQEAQLRREVEIVQKERTQTTKGKGGDAGALASDSDCLARGVAKQVSAIRNFYLWVCTTIAAIAVWSSGKVLQQRRQLAQAFGSAMSKPLSLKPGDANMKEDLLSVTPAAGKKSRGFQGAFQNNSKQCDSQEAGIQAPTMKGRCEMVETGAQTEPSDLSTAGALAEELKSAKEENEAIKKQLEEIEALEVENLALKERGDKYVQALSLNYALKGRKSITEEMDPPEHLQATEPAFYDDDFVFSPHTAVGINGSIETSANLFNEALATLERFGAGVANYDDTQNGSVERDSAGDEPLPSHQIRDRALHVLLESGNVGCS